MWYLIMKLIIIVLSIFSNATSIIQLVDLIPMLDHVIKLVCFWHLL